MSLYAGFDLGGTHLKHGVINQNGKVIFKDKIETPTKVEELIRRIEKIWEKLKKQHKEPSIGKKKKFINLPIFQNSTVSISILLFLASSILLSS
jgi:predicted NBD/HSP70 family sugar kinase